MFNGLNKYKCIISARSVAEWKLAFKNPWKVPDRNKEGTESPSLLLSLKVKS